MKKTICTAISTLVFSGMSFAAQPVAYNPSEGPIHGDSAIILQNTNVAIKPEVNFSIQGYTIFGALLVVGARAKMKSQTEDFQKAVDGYLKDHPEAKNIKDVFNETLTADLKGKNISLDSAPLLSRSVSEENKISYHIPEEQFKQKHAVVLDNLFAGYVANSSTDPYQPVSSIMVTVMDHDAKDHNISFIKFHKPETESADTQFAGYENIQKDTAKAYGLMKDSTVALAHEVAAMLTK